jgi:hypothetical protein
MITNDDARESKVAKAYFCVCGKKYKYRQGLNTHKKKCSLFKEETENEEKEEKEKEEKAHEEQEEKEKEQEENEQEQEEEEEEQEENEQEQEEITNVIVKNEDDNDSSYKQMCMNMMQLMKEQQKQINEMIPKIGNNNTTTNNQFNLQIFLNETCKDALNITDFIASLQIQMEDLVNTGKLGFAESTSQLLIKGLNELEVTKRPIHCSDLKRETLYIKDNNVWEKETENKEKMTKAVRHLQKESFGVIPDWVKEHPGCARGDNKNNDLYMEIVGNTAGVDKVKDVNKIVKKLAKETVIDKKDM